MALGGLDRAFQWRLKREGIIAPDERLPWGQTIAVGVQHVFAMFGATVLVPILMGFDANTAILFSGIGTLIFFVIVGGRVPSSAQETDPIPDSVANTSQIVGLDRASLSERVGKLARPKLELVLAGIDVVLRR